MHILTLNNSALQPTRWQAQPIPAGILVDVIGSHPSVKTSKDLRPLRTFHSMQFRITGKIHRDLEEQCNFQGAERNFKVKQHYTKTLREIKGIIASMTKEQVCIKIIFRE